MLLQQVAIVSEVRGISASELTRVGAALQKQAIRDFSPIWNVQATVDPFVSLDDVPVGYWPIIIRDDINANALGIHMDTDGQPFALVRLNEGWALTASHECLEMLADPFGNRLIAGPSKMQGQGRVEYLAEVCDPSESAEFAYTVNGITVSDFYTPNFFDPVEGPGVRYSFTGAIRSPRQVLRGGYLSWHDPISDEWFQERFFGAAPEFKNLGRLTGAESLRAFIDHNTQPPESGVEPSRERRVRVEALTAAGFAEPATNAKANKWREIIERLKAAS